MSSSATASAIDPAPAASGIDQPVPTLLVLNPNTSQDVTALLAAAAQRVAAAQLERLAAQHRGPGPGRAPGPVRIRTVTAPFGPRYITGEVGAAIAAHGAMEGLALDVQAHGVPTAVLLACFGDPGLFALRALAPCPVLGLAEASMRAAAAIGPFVVLTGGAAWVPMLQRLAQALPLPAPMLGVQALPRSGGEMAAQPQQAVEWLAEAGAQALQRWPQARALLLGGAGLAGLAAPLAGRLPVPVLDNVALALEAALAAARGAFGPVAHGDGAPSGDPGLAGDHAAVRAGAWRDLPGEPAEPGEPGPWQGLGPGLSGWLPGGPSQGS